MTGTYHPQSSDELKKKLAKGYACTQKELDRLWKEVDEIADWFKQERNDDWRQRD